MKRTRVLEGLKNIVGEDYASSEDYLLYVYKDDMTTSTPSAPDFVAMPNNVKEIQEILKLANIEKVPVTPFVNGSNVAGLTIPVKGGIIVDLKRMDRIIEVNSESRYVIIEPAVSMGKLKATLEKHDLQFSMAMGPANQSVLTNYLAAGSGTLMTRYGNNADLITGLEAVLPTGELARFGSCAVSPFWFSAYALPHLMGLFIGWLGTTGIATKIGIKTMPLPKYRDVIDFAFNDISDITYPLGELGKAEVADLIINTNWAYLRSKEELNSRTMVSKPKDMPETYFEIIFSGKTLEEIDYKSKIIRKIFEETKAKAYDISLKEVPPDLKAHHMEYPTPRPMMYADHRGGGLDWVGSVMPISKWPEAYRKCRKTMMNHGFSPILDLEVEDNYHYGLFRAIVPFNRGDPEEVEKTKKLIIKLTEVILDEGGVIYKPHDWMAEMMRKKGDPGYFDLLKRVKELLDPNGIMNPGRWNF